MFFRASRRHLPPLFTANTDKEQVRAPAPVQLTLSVESSKVAAGKAAKPAGLAPPRTAAGRARPDRPVPLPIAAGRKHIRYSMHTAARSNVAAIHGDDDDGVGLRPVEQKLTPRPLR